MEDNNKLPKKKKWYLTEKEMRRWKDGKKPLNKDEAERRKKEEKSLEYYRKVEAGEIKRRGTEHGYEDRRSPEGVQRAREAFKKYFGDGVMVDEGMKKRFIQEYGATLSIPRACKNLGLHPEQVYRERRADSDFDKAIKKQKSYNIDTLKSEAVRRGYEGVDRAVYHKGVVVGYEKEYSDRMLVRLIEANDPNWRMRGNQPLNVSGDKVQVNIINYSGSENEQLSNSYEPPQLPDDDDDDDDDDRDFTSF